MSTKSRAPRVRSWYTEVFIACIVSGGGVCCLSVYKNSSCGNSRSIVDFPAGEIDFGGLRQVGPLHAEGQAELLSNTLGEIRIRGKVKAEIEADCDRCLEPVHRPIDSDFDLFYRPTPDKHCPPRTRDR